MSYYLYGFFASVRPSDRLCFCGINEESGQYASLWQVRGAEDRRLSSLSVYLRPKSLGITGYTTVHVRSSTSRKRGFGDGGTQKKWDVIRNCAYLLACELYHNLLVLVLRDSPPKMSTYTKTPTMTRISQFLYYDTPFCGGKTSSHSQFFLLLSTVGRKWWNARGRRREEGQKVKSLPPTPVFPYTRRYILFAEAGIWESEGSATPLPPSSAVWGNCLHESTALYCTDSLGLYPMSRAKLTTKGH